MAIATKNRGMAKEASWKIFGPQKPEDDFMTDKKFQNMFTPS